MSTSSYMNKVALCSYTSPKHAVLRVELLFQSKLFGQIHCVQNYLIFQVHVQQAMIAYFDVISFSHQSKYILLGVNIGPRLFTIKHHSLCPKSFNNAVSLIAKPHSLTGSCPARHASCNFRHQQKYVLFQANQNTVFLAGYVFLQVLG